MGIISTIMGAFGFGSGIALGLVIGYFLFIYVQPSTVEFSNLQSMSGSRRWYVFEIRRLHRCEDHERKIKRAIGAHLVKIDLTRGHVIVSTHQDSEKLKLALKDKTGRKVELLYEILSLNPEPARHARQEGSSVASTSTEVKSSKIDITIKHEEGRVASRSNLVLAEVKGSDMKITIGYQDEGAVVNAPEGNNSRSRTHLKSHHEHGLTSTKGERSSYKCSGCKEWGIGDRYVCKHCSYILHPDCRFYEEEATHKFLYGSTFTFNQAAPSDGQRWCDACGLYIEGFFYHSEKHNEDLHPCCLSLQETVCVGEMKFRLCRKLTSKCLYCDSKKKDDKKDHKDNYWCYSLEGSNEGSEAHVSCLKDALLECLQGKSNNEMRSMAIVKHHKKRTKGVKWAKMLLQVALALLSGNPFPAFEVFLELLN